MWEGRTGLGRDRVLKGHVAAVHALTLCGVPFTECCLIAGVSPGRMKQYVRQDWWKRPTRRGRWSGVKLERLAAAYADHAIGVRQIVRDHGVTQGTLYKLAQRYRWPLRPKGRKAKAVALRDLSPGRQAYYDRLRASGVSGPEALLGAQRGAEPIKSTSTDTFPRPAGEAANPNRSRGGHVPSPLIDA